MLRSKTEGASRGHSANGIVIFLGLFCDGESIFVDNDHYSSGNLTLSLVGLFCLSLWIFSVLHLVCGGLFWRAMIRLGLIYAHTYQKSEDLNSMKMVRVKSMQSIHSTSDSTYNRND